jgi:hypothetical protein
MNGPQPTPNLSRRTISIESKPAYKGQKTRSFSVELLAWVLANSMWELGSSGKENNYRPIFLAYAGSSSAARAFQANLQSGRVAADAGGGSFRLEVPRSAGFRYEPTSRGEGTLTLVYLPHLFSLQPATTDAGNLSFICMPPTAWVDEQARAIAPSMGSEAREAAVAAYFVAYLDARSALPIANDLRFHLALFRAAKEQPWCDLSQGSASSPGALFAEGLSGIGFEPPVLCNVAPAVFADFLARQTAKNLPKEPRPEVNLHGTTRIHRPRRVLPRSQAPAAQLSLFG